MIKPLTSLRFIFALLVFFSHLQFLENGESNLLNWLYTNIFVEGYIGVSFFFILSGFIIAYNYQDSILEKKGTVSAFYKKRFARIYPLHILTFILTLPYAYNVFVENIYSGIAKALTNLTLTQSFILDREYFFSFNAPSWSISDEMFFYCLFPILILKIPSLNRVKKYAVLSFVILFPLISFFVPESYHRAIFYINPLFRLVDFVIGIILFNIFRQMSAKKYSAKWNFNIIEISVIILFLAFFSFHQYIPQAAKYSFYYWIPMSLIVLVFAHQKGIISRLLSNKIFIHLGKLSFGFYLYHQIILKYIIFFNHKIYHLNNYQIIVFVLTFTLLISHFSYKYYEQPMNKYLKKKMIGEA